VEQLAVETMRVCLDSDNLLRTVLAQWSKLEGMEVAS